MEETQKQQQNWNEKIVDDLFSLLFDVVWIPRTDPRNSGVYAEFRQGATELANMLFHLDLTSVDEVFLQQVLRQLEQLREHGMQLSREKIISVKQHANTEVIIDHIVELVRCVCCEVAAVTR